MNKKVELVYKGFLTLSAAERDELIKAINTYINSTYKERSDLEEVYKTRRITLGPLPSDTCPCCGR